MSRVQVINLMLTRWVPDMSEEDGKQLVRDAIRAGIFNDMGSGSNVDLVVLKAKDDVRDDVEENGTI